MPDTLEELQALEREVEREWWWLHGALTAVAQVQAERSNGDFSRFRAMQRQVLEVDRRRVEIAVRIARIERDSLTLTRNQRPLLYWKSGKRLPERWPSIGGGGSHCSNPRSRAKCAVTP